MTLYAERMDSLSGIVFWCGHREFDEYGNTSIGEGDHPVLIATEAFLVGCAECFLTLCNVVLESGVFIPDGAGPITFWCKHREWIDYIGQPAPGDVTFEIIRDGDAFIVLCPDCAHNFGLSVAQKAVRLKFENVEILEDIIRGD